jgi:hypothetical protein
MNRFRTGVSTAVFDKVFFLFPDAPCPVDFLPDRIRPGLDATLPLISKITKAGLVVGGRP